MTSQIKGSGKQSRVAEVCSIENKKDHPLKARFLAVRKKIHNHYNDKWKTDVCKVKDADGKMVGPAFKTMKSECVAWQEAIGAKKYDLHDEKQHDHVEKLFVPMSTSSSGRLCCYPGSIKLHGTRRQTSVNRTTHKRARCGRFR